MWIAAVAALLALVILVRGIRRFLAEWRGAPAEALPVRELERIAGLLPNLAVVLAIAATPFVPAVLMGVRVAAVLLAVLLGLALVVVVAARVLPALSRIAVDAALASRLQDPSTSVPRAASLLAAAWCRGIIRRAARAWRRLVPRSVGWSEISRIELGRSLGVRAHVVYYAAAVVLLPLFLVAGLLAAYARSGELDQAVFEAFFGFNSLLIGTTVMVPFLAMTLILILLRLAGVLAFAPDLALAMRRLGGAIGGGTAVGAVTAMILPLFAAYLPLDGGEPLGDEGLSGMGRLVFPASPALLLEIPAVGAVLGLFVGVPLALVAIGDRAKNRLIAIFSGPLLYGLLLLVGTWAGITPRNLFERTMENSTADAALPVVDCADEQSLLGHLEDPAGAGDSLVHVMSQCSAGTIVSTSWLLGVALLVIGVFAVSALLVELRSPRRPAVEA